MKKVLSHIIMFAIVFVLIKDLGPGASETTYYSGGSNGTTTDASHAQVYDNISDAYQKQVSLGTEWRIVTR